MKLRLRTELERARAREQRQRLDQSGHPRRRSEPERGLQARLEQALSALEEAHIGTIHAFCGDLLHERPVEAGVDPRFEVGGEDDAEALFDLVFDRFIQSQLEHPKEGIRRALRRGGRQASALSLLSAAARTLREQRDFDAAWTRPELAREREIDQLMQALKELAALQAHAASPRDPLKRDLAVIRDFVRQREELQVIRGKRDYDELEAGLRDLLHKSIWARKGRGKFYAPGVLRDEVLALRSGVQVRLADLCARLDADLAALLREDLRPVIDEYERAKGRVGKLDYLDLLIKARDLLRHNATVRHHLQRRFTHVFVDEFQDTDPIQAEIILLLCRAEPPPAQPARAKPAQAASEAPPTEEPAMVPGKLFVVGDPKQAIYRFRRADVTLYERVKRDLVAQGGDVVYLTTSFRSLPAIQELVNATFERVMQPAEDGSQAAYRPLSPYRKADPSQPAVIALPVPRPYGTWGSVTKAAIEQSLPDAVGAFIAHLIGGSGLSVMEGQQRVPLSARHICLLFRRFRSFGQDCTRPYVRALEQRSIPHVLLGGRSLHSREEVVALSAALGAIEWPGDPLQVYAALRGPFFSFSDEALLDFRSAVGPLHPLTRTDAEDLSGTRAEVARALSLLGELHVKRNRRGTQETIHALLDATRAHAGIAIWPAGEQALANLLRVADQARRFERGGTTSFRAFVEWLGRKDPDNVREAPVIEDGTEGVRVMTVHTAKGLEFPVVLLCDPTVPRTARTPSRYVDANAGLWACPLMGCAPLELRRHSEDVLAADEAEEIRVAYVAATRARDLLVVPAVGDEPRAGWVDILHPGLYPARPDRRRARRAPGCPAFGQDSVLEAPARAQRVPDESVQPGLHRPLAGPHEVVWWDPAMLSLDVEPLGGLRQKELLVEDEGGVHAQTGMEMHARWVARRDSALTRGRARDLIAVPVTTLAHVLSEAPNIGPAHDHATDTVATNGPEPALRMRPVRLEHVSTREPGRPRGKRFGSLVHAVIADAEFDPHQDWL
ncbi:MAG: UvrD-helicase domain-containing protein, partial [Myxococcales bacterium]|nr:UvrD-helicase domain-containing protein [Myxococcales bacterium]